MFNCLCNNLSKINYAKRDVGEYWYKPENRQKKIEDLRIIFGMKEIQAMMYLKTYTLFSNEVKSKDFTGKTETFFSDTGMKKETRQRAYSSNAL